MRIGPPAILSLALATLACAGCASQRSAEPATAPDEVVALPPEPNVHLLFDPGMEYPLAAGITYRSDWPSTPSYSQGPERIAYRESIYDIQGLRGFSRDLTYRQFRVERVGIAER